jgi:hypothetical protein
MRTAAGGSPYRMRNMSALWKPAGLMLPALLALAALAWAGPVQAYEISVLNPSKSRVRVEAFVIGSDLSCQGLGPKEIAPGGSAKWDSRGLCTGGLSGEYQTNEGGWTAMSETSCLGAARPRHDWTACCRDLRFTVCPGPGGGLRFCAH